MTMPEYAAEASLYRSGGTYRGAARNSLVHGAVPNRVSSKVDGANAWGSIDDASKLVGIRRRDLRNAARPRATSSF